MSTVRSPLPAPDASGSLAPPLTSLDQRVLGALAPGAPGQRVGAIVEHANRGLDQWSRNRTDAAEVVGILRGLEHLGRVRGSHGWWRRMDHDSTERTA